MDIGQRLRQVRTVQGMSQEALAEKLDVSRQTISKWENGAAYPSGENLAALSEVFGLPVEALIHDGWTPPEQPEPVIVEVPVEVPVPAPRNYRLWALVIAILVAVGIVIGALGYRFWSAAPVSNHEVKVEVIDPATLGSGVPFLPFEDDL